MPMHPKDRKRFPESFPQALLDATHSLEEWNLTESVWRYEDIKRVINFLVDARYVIRGGDVYLEEAGQWFQMTDNWSVNDPDSRLWRDRTEAEKQRILEASRNQSLAYVERYWKRNGDHYYYSIVASPVDAHWGKKGSG